MAEFRYAQFCPLARATEVLGERWTLLVVRELLLGPQRFSDLLRRLSGVSSSVLADRLARLEVRGVVERRELPPPAGATVYELTETGQGLLPVLIELSRWGAHFLEPPAAGDHLEPSWVRLGFLAFARRGPTPPRGFRLALPDGEQDVVFYARGGPEGTRVGVEPCPVDAALRCEPLTLMGLMAGRLEPAAALRAGDLSVEGDVDAVADFPALFEISLPTLTPNPD